MGRPRQGEPRDQQLNLSFTTAEIAILRRRADACGVPLYRYGRERLLEARSARRTPDEPPGPDHALLLALKRLGNNLNQIARRLNASREPAPPTLEPLLRDIRAVLSRELGRS